MRLQRILVVALLAILSVLTAYIVIGQQFAYGPVLLSMTGDHGVHLSDVPVVGLWLAGAVVCAALWAPPRD